MEDATSQTRQTEKTSDLKNWMMFVLTFVFVSLYTAALTGWLRPLSDITILTRLEPIIFVIIGYYFGRLPAVQNEKTLKEEVDRQTQNASAAQHTKEKVQKEIETLEEKIKNARTVLSAVADSASSKLLSSSLNERQAEFNPELLKHSVSTSIKILNS